MVKRNDKRWGEDSNERLARWSYRDNGWERRKIKLDDQPLWLSTRMIKCSKGSDQCLKVTDALIKRIKAMHSLGIKEIIVDKQTGIPASMLKGVIKGSVKLTDNKWFKVIYKGRGTWQIIIAG